MKYPTLFALMLIFFSFSVASAQTFTAQINSAQITPPNNSSAVGVGSVVLNGAESSVTVTLYYSGLSGALTAAKIYNSNGIVFDLPGGNFTQNFAVSSAQAADLKTGAWYFKISSANFPNGEISGQIAAVAPTAAASFPFSGGALDSTFGTGGIVTTVLGGGNTVAQAVAVQTDGKIVVCGFGRETANDDFVVARYNPNGSLDTTFDGDGIAVTAISPYEDQAYAVAIQPDGKIVVAGHTFGGPTIDAALVRYNSNGSLDTTFGGGGGIVTTPIGDSNDFLRSIALQTDGKIVVAGIKYNSSTSDIAVLRFNADGSLDQTFDGDAGNGNGIVTTVLGSGYSYGYAVTVQPDNKILVAGYYFNGANNNDSAIIRYNPNGTLDASFGAGGIAGTVIGAGTDEAFAIALQTDGRIVIAGCVNRGGGNDFLIARYNSNGSPDANFGTGGATITPIGNGVEIASGAAIQADGKIVAAGFSSNGANNDFAVIRRNADGSLDTTFDGDGKLITAIGVSTDSANGVVMQADGKIVVVGRTIIGSTSNFGIVRYGYGVNAQANDGFLNLDAVTAVRFDNAFQSGTTTSAPINSLALPPLPANLKILMSPRSIRTSAGFSGDAVVKLTLPARVNETNFNAAQVLHFENGAWTDRTTAAPPRDFATRSIYARVSSLGEFAVGSPLAQTAERATIFGRILMASGRSAAGSIVTLTDLNGQVNYTISNQFGYYRFLNVALREVYIVRVSSKRARFSPQILTINNDDEVINFAGR